MKKINAILKGLVLESSIENKVKKINSHLELAKTNIEGDILELEEQYDNTVLGFAEKESNIKENIQTLLDLTDSINNAKQALVNLELIKASLEEEVEVEE